MTELTIFLSIYGFAAAYCGWCLCWAAHREMPPPRKCDDSVFEPRVKPTG